MNALLLDIRYALRTMVKSPAFTAAAVLTLGLGIGTCALTFTLVHAVLLRPLPFRDAERLVWIENRPRPIPVTPGVSVDNFVDWQTQSESFEGLAAFNAFFEQNGSTLTGVGEPERLRGVEVSQEFLDVLGVAPILGRSFVSEECVLNGRRAAILSHGVWQRKFGGAEDVIGMSVRINGEPVEIVGVLPPSDHLDTLFSPGSNIDLLLPFPLTEEAARVSFRWGNMFYVVGRLKPGTSVSQARSELAVIDERLNRSKPERVKQNGGYEVGAHLVPLEDHVRGPFRPAFAMLAGSVLCVLLVACVNISNLLLARLNARRRHLAVQAALGATVWRLVRQTLIESLLLALAGGALGLLGAFVGGTLLAQLRVFGVPLLRTAAMDGTSLAATVALVCTAAALSALLPATQLWRTGASTGLREAGTRGSAGRGSTRMRRGFVVSEIVLACMLVVAAGLLIRSFIGVLQVDMGFEPENALTWRIEEHRSFDSQVDRVAFYERLVERVAAVPGVESAGLGDSLPLSTKRSWSLSVEGVSYDTEVYPVAAVVLIDQHYLRTMRIPLRSGRDFDSRDSAGSAPVMIVNETMAANLWPGQDPIGRTARVNGPECTVVGVVADVRQGLEEATRPEMYLSLRQRDSYQWTAPRLVVRSTRTPAALVPDVRAALKEVDANLASNEVTTLDQVVDRAIAPRRLITGLLAFFSSCALLLAALGLYGVIAYSVDQRTREIGVRLALGARRRDVLRLVLEEGLQLTGAGVLAGSAAAFVVMRLVQSQLYGVTATDPTTYGAAAVVLGGAACLASTLPAWRAARTDPAVALRHE